MWNDVQQVHQWMTYACRRMVSLDSRSKFTKFGEHVSIVKTPNNAKFCRAPTKSVRDICGRKFVLPKKLTVDDLIYAPMPVIVRNFIALGQTVYEKSVTNFCYTLYYFGVPEGDLLGHSSSIWVVMYSKVPSINFSNFTPFWKSCLRYLLPKFVDFVDCVTHRQSLSEQFLNGTSAHHRLFSPINGENPQTDTQNSKRYVSADHAATTSPKQYNAIQYLHLSRVHSQP